MMVKEDVKAAFDRGAYDILLPHDQVAAKRTRTWWAENMVHFICEQ